APISLRLAQGRLRPLHRYCEALDARTRHIRIQLRFGDRQRAVRCPIVRLCTLQPAGRGDGCIIERKPKAAASGNDDVGGNGRRACMADHETFRYSCTESGEETTSPGYLDEPGGPKDEVLDLVGFGGK